MGASASQKLYDVEDAMERMLSLQHKVGIPNIIIGGLAGDLLIYEQEVGLSS